MSDTVYRLRITFAKQGRLAWLSHLELVRALERCIRRSGLPLQFSQGFNQHIKHSFGPALPVGTAGVAELCDVWLMRY
ncbi:MAG: TIGR03936 family radical SAM-associated protein, partial [Coriobacteriales bacterium]|nr:TIGR03936 family radical SAM-associated protein [Coriobacteriales bacterium]